MVAIFRFGENCCCSLRMVVLANITGLRKLEGGIRPLTGRTGRNQSLRLKLRLAILAA